VELGLRIRKPHRTLLEGEGSQSPPCGQGRGGSVKYVYILQSIADAERFYVGLTDDLRSRLARHNGGQVSHTSKHAPWRVKTYLGFSDPAQAVAFEKYLKSASGRAFAIKRL
jgi:predicted GIY-YIG superfamily endonuclease